MEEKITIDKEALPLLAKVLQGQIRSRMKELSAAADKIVDCRKAVRNAEDEYRAVKEAVKDDVAFLNMAQNFISKTKDMQVDWNTKDIFSYVESLINGLKKEGFGYVLE